MYPDSRRGSTRKILRIGEMIAEEFHLREFKIGASSEELPTPIKTPKAAKISLRSRLQRIAWGGAQRNPRSASTDELARRAGDTGLHSNTNRERLGRTVARVRGLTNIFADIPWGSAALLIIKTWVINSAAEPQATR
jgi:hypothetical protein